MSAKLIINQETLDRLRNGQPWGAFAKEIGVDQGTLSRIRREESLPSNAFIATIVSKYPVRMDEIVTVAA